jgi:hypothetical protein
LKHPGILAPLGGISPPKRAKTLHAKNVKEKENRELKKKESPELIP